MKNRMSLTTFSLFSLLFFASADYLVAGDYSKAYEYLQKDPKKHEAELRLILPTLDPGDRMALYGFAQKDILPGYLVNWLLGLGIGSFMQGDPLGGAIGLTGDLLSVGAMATGVALLTPPYGGGNLTAAAVCASAGLVVYLVSKVYQMFRPIYFVQRYNDQLARFLLSEGKFQWRF
ncbi:MAG: P13 family porin [Spirochaetes bacterium]|nr:P13 family porin [Spirochaetota bacterium]